MARLETNKFSHATGGKMKFFVLSLHERMGKLNIFLRWVIRISVGIGAVMAFGFILIKVTHASYLLSPGGLSSQVIKGQMLGEVSSHADLNRQCSHCHAPVHCVEDTRCQDCHFEIAQDREDINTLHGRLPGVSKCQNCHPEHNGSDADLTLLPYLNVDHFLLAGFSLEKHQKNYDGSNFDCETCHQQNVSMIKTIDCVDCHANQDHDTIAAHIEQFGDACSECHDGRDRMLNGFVHEPYFSLQGGHKDLQCSQCHQKEQYVDLPSNCAACHSEPEIHAGVFGTSCESCHTSTAWTPAQLQQHAFGLEHGGDSIENCQNCHTETFTECDCSSCHKEEDMNMAGMNQQAQQNGLIAQNTDNNPLFNHESPQMGDCLACHPAGLVESGKGMREQTGNSSQSGQSQGLINPPSENQDNQPPTGSSGKKSNP